MQQHSTLVQMTSGLISQVVPFCYFSGVAQRMGGVAEGDYIIIPHPFFSLTPTASASNANSKWARTK